MTNFTPGRLLTAEAAKIFTLGGNATLTLVSTVSGIRYTYKIRVSNDFRVHFVSVLYGSDNESDFAYIGMIKDDVFVRTEKSTVRIDDKRYRAFSWFWDRLITGTLPDSVEVWHCGKCCRCGRKLTVPQSVKNGIGPEM